MIVGKQEMAAAALAALRAAQFAQPVEGVDLWIWSAPAAPDVDALFALALQVAGDDVVAGAWLTGAGLQFAVSDALYVVPWSAIDAKAFGAVRELMSLKAVIWAGKLRGAAGSPTGTEQEDGNGRTIH